MIEVRRYDMDGRKTMFKTIRETVKLGIASENFIRNMVRQGTCPGIYSGNRFLVNVEQLVDLLNELSRPRVAAGPEAIKEAMRQDDRTV